MVRSLFHLLTYWVLVLAACSGTFPIGPAASDSGESTDPTDYFAGSQHRPKLEIVKPENGQVLNEGVLDIEITISGYELPSHFDESSTCIALTKNKGVGVIEHCFDQNSELTFHVNGLTPGETYSLRVLFLERGKVIALSVRSFRVGGVVGVLEDDEHRPVSIHTALQVALRHQVNGMHAEAERIFQGILDESPMNADALNYLGVNFYQQGDHMRAIAYMEQALVSNHSDLADSYYNLGEVLCLNFPSLVLIFLQVYRVIGEIEKAKEHFEISLSINPNYTSSMYKLGLIYQQNFRQFEMARALYRRLLKLELDNQVKSLMSKEELHECKIRECDLLSILQKENENLTSSFDLLNCWKEGITVFPFSGLMFNELGNNYLQRSMHEAAFQAYSSAAKLGFFVAFINRASVLEIQGYTADAKAAFEETIEEASKNQLPSFHVRIRLATVLPRIFPSSEHDLQEIRNDVRNQLDELLVSTPPPNIENVAPIDYGFSTGYYLAFHGLSNVDIKQKMFQAYVLFCPALSHGRFASAFEKKDNLRDLAMPANSPSLSRQGNVYSDRKSKADNVFGSGVGYTEVADVAEPEDIDLDEFVKFEYWGEEDLGEWETFIVSTESVSSFKSFSLVKPQADTSSQPFPQHADKIPAIDHSSHRLGEDAGDDLRVGFVSRFLYNHPVGLMFEEVIRLLAACSKIHVEVIMLESSNLKDPVVSNIRRHANAVQNVQPDLNLIVDAIRSADLDVLIFTDLGLDPMSYFASFSRLAPIQATGTLHVHFAFDFRDAVSAGMGHFDTSGVPTIDYYISDDVELPESSSSYSETLVLLPGMGTCFVDRLNEAAVALMSPRTALLDRAKYIEKIGIPRSAHLYVIVQPLFALHSMFDECISRVLVQDKLGYVIILNPGNSWHSSHHSLFFKRLSSRISDDAMRRILTFQYLQTPDFIHKTIAAAHVMLDPFPGGSYHSSLHALSLGIPVITLPSKTMMSRQCLSLYKRLGYFELVVSSPLEYATLALTLAHKPKIRQSHVNYLMKHRLKLFDCTGVRSNWVQFFKSAIEKSNDIHLRNKSLALEDII